MRYYQVVAYSWDHWINQKVSKITGSPYNHVTIRVTTREKKQELFVCPQPSDTFIDSAVIERMNGGPLFIGPAHYMSDTMYMTLLEKALWWQQNQPGSILRAYFHHYIGRHLGMKAPWTCTRLVQEILNSYGMTLDEDFYPGHLLVEYAKTEVRQCM